MTDAPAVAFESAMQFGGTVFGVAVASMRLTLTDGRQVSFELPVPAAAKAAKRLTEVEQDVLAVIEDMPVGEVWPAAKILDKAGWEVTTEIRRFIRSLKHLGTQTRQGFERAKDGPP